MAKDFNKIFGVILLAIITIVILYLSLFTYEEKGKEKIKTIKVYGNNLLSAAKYMKLTGLDRQQVYSNLSLNIIKRKIEKHPYVAKASVKSDGRGNVNVNIEEKEIYAVFLNHNETFFLTGDYELLKIQDYTTYPEIPVISNAIIFGNISSSNKLANKDIADAFNIIDATKIIGNNFAKKLSEINLNRGGEIILTFSGVNYPVLFGRGNESKKLVGLNLFWEKYSNLTENLSHTEYIDLRFSNTAYIGNKVNASLRQ
jgi:cell division protein FtsQ